LKSALLATFKGVGADLELARKLYYLVRQAGLHDVQLLDHPYLPSDPLIRWSIIRPPQSSRCELTILELGLLRENDLAVALADCRKHLAKSETAFTLYTVAQVWGQKA